MAGTFGKVSSDAAANNDESMHLRVRVQSTNGRTDGRQNMINICTSSDARMTYMKSTRAHRLRTDAPKAIASRGG